MTVLQSDRRNDEERALETLHRRWPRRCSWLEPDGVVRRYSRLKQVSGPPTGRRSYLRSPWLRQPDALDPPPSILERPLAYSTEGSTRASGSFGGPALLRSVNPDDWRTLACDVANRDLTPEEWNQFVGDEKRFQPTCANLVPNAGAGGAAMGSPTTPPFP
jgi:hypothetical protein